MSFRRLRLKCKFQYVAKSKDQVERKWGWLVAMKLNLKYVATGEKLQAMELLWDDSCHSVPVLFFGRCSGGVYPRQKAGHKNQIDCR